MTENKTLTAPGGTAVGMVAVTLLLTCAMILAACAALAFPQMTGDIAVSYAFAEKLFGTAFRVVAFGVCSAFIADIVEKRNSLHR